MSETVYNFKEMHKPCPLKGHTGFSSTRGGFTSVWCLCTLTQVQQNIHVAVAEYAKLKQQLEKNTIIITILGHLKEVQHTWQIIRLNLV